MTKLKINDLFDNGINWDIVCHNFDEANILRQAIVDYQDKHNINIPYFYEPNCINKNKDDAEPNEWVHIRILKDYYQLGRSVMTVSLLRYEDLDLGE